MRWSDVLSGAVQLENLISALGTLRGSQVTCDDGSAVKNEEGCRPPAHGDQDGMNFIVARDAQAAETVTLTISAFSDETITYTIPADYTLTVVSTTSVLTTTTEDGTVISTTTVATETIDVPTGTTTVTTTATSVDDEVFTTIIVSTEVSTTTVFPPTPSSSLSASSTSSASSSSTTSSLSSSPSTTLSSSSATPTVALQAATPYVYIGTYQNPGGSIIDNSLSQGDAGSIEACAADCAAGYNNPGNSAQYAYMSYQAGDQCLCGSALDGGATTSNGPMDACTGNPSEVCGGYDSTGGYDIAVVYSIVVGSSTSTLVTSSTNSIFSSSSSTLTSTTPTSSPSTSSSTISSSPSLSSFSSSATASCPAPAVTVTETVTTTLNAVMSPTSGSSSTDTNSPVNGNSPTTASSNPTASSPSGPSSTTTSSPPAGPTIVQQAGTYIYRNCYADFTSPRPIDGPNNFSITSVEDCASYCSTSATGPYTYFGIEYTDQCFCSNTLDVSQGLSTNCNLPCSGSSAEICGGGNAMDVYSATNLPTTTYSTSTIARPTTVPTATPYVHVACYVDNINGRLLDAAEDDSTGTIELCASHCINAAGGPYAYFGMEYYSQCFCGNAYNESAPASTGCSFPCSGNGNEICGGSNALDVYYNTQLVSTAPPQPMPT